MDPEECFSFSAEYFEHTMNQQFLLEHRVYILGKSWSSET